MTDETDETQEEYTSGPYCPHWSDPSECDRLCTCGDLCRQHNESCNECPCLHFTEQPEPKPDRKLISKLLWLELRRMKVIRDENGKLKSIEHGPVEATVRGYDAADEFLKSKGTALIREKVPLGPGEPISMIRMPEGWASMVVGMVNFYDDGTCEGM